MDFHGLPVKHIRHAPRRGPSICVFADGSSQPAFVNQNYHRRIGEGPFCRSHRIFKRRKKLHRNWDIEALGQRDDAMKRTSRRNDDNNGGLTGGKFAVVDVVA
jgi:hypothetical protein